VPAPVTYVGQKEREADTSVERTAWWFSKKNLG
jgi:hypothetical protein